MKHSPGFLAIVEDAKSGVAEMTVEEYGKLKESGEAHVLVDVREDNEWNSAHATGAVHLGKGIIERDIENTVPDKDARIVLYCGGGYRSILAASALMKMGYRNPVSLAGGWRAWNEAGFPVDKP